MCSIASDRRSCSARRRLGGEEHEIEIAERRHLAAPGAAEPDERQLALGGRSGRRCT